MRYFFYSILVIFSVWSVATVTFGQGLNTVGIAEIYSLGADVLGTSGDIISIEQGVATTTYKLANTLNDGAVVGVIALEPLILFDNNSSGVPLVREGQAEVKVSTINGSIVTGDVITTGTLPGRGQRADGGTTRMVGIALESFPTSTDTTALPRIEVEGREVFLGAIAVDVKIGPAASTGNILDFNQNIIGRLERFDDTRTAVQIIVAALLALGSIFFAFRNFGSSIQNGILSVGRNPKAKFSIQSTVFLHLFLIVIISGVGIILGFIILSVPLF